MKFVTIRDLRSKSAEIKRRLPEEMEMVLTCNGVPIAILASVVPDTLEESLAAFRRARAIMAVANIQAQSVKRGLDKMPLDDINKIIKDVRKQYKRR